MKQSVHRLACLSLILFASVVTCAQKPELVVQTGHSGWVQSVEFSPDGKTLASSSFDGTIKFWDVSTGTLLRSLNVGRSGVDVKFSPDGRILASNAEFDHAIRLWDVITGAQLGSLGADRESDFASLAFSPDSKTLASVAKRGTTRTIIKLWDVASGTQVRSLDAPPCELFGSCVFSPNGKVLASGGEKAIRLWDVLTGTLILSFGEADSDSLWNVAFTSDGNTLVSRGDKTIKLWDVSTGKLIRSLEVDRDVIALSSDGETLASGSDDNDRTIKFWDFRTSGLTRTIDAHGTDVRAVAFSPDGKTLASGGFYDSTIKLWDVSTGAQVRSLGGHAKSVNSVVFSSNNKIVATGSEDSGVELWDVSKGIKLPSLEAETRSVASVAFSPDGKLLASGSFDCIKLWDVSAGVLLRTQNEPLVRSVAFSPDGKVLASGGGWNDTTWTGKSTIKLWDVATGRQLLSLSGHTSAINSVAFSLDGKMLASGSLGTIMLWNVSTGSLLRSLNAQGILTQSIVFSPDGKILASGGWLIKLWDISTGAELRRIDGYAVKSLTFSPDGKTLVGGGHNAKINLWDVATGVQLRSLLGHSIGINSVAFSPDGKTLSSGAEDGTTKLWDMSSGKEIISLISLDHNDWIALTPEGLFDGSPTAWGKLIWRSPQNTFDYLPVEAYFNEFYYPGLLADIFAGKHLKASSDISKRDRRQPQVKISLSEARPDTTLTTRSVKVKIDIAQAPAGAQDVRLFRNGSLLKVWHGDVLKGQSSVMLEATVPIVAGENRLTAYAFNHDNIKSSDASLAVNGADSLKRAGTLYVLAVGSNKYKSAGFDLKFALADVYEISQQVKTYQEKLSNYARTEVITLTDENATKANIMLALRRFAEGSKVSGRRGGPPTLKQELAKIKTIEPEDGLVIYYAGHGTAIGEHFYLLPHDFAAGNEGQLKATSISDIELNEVLERVDTGKLLLVIDACQSGQALGDEKEGRGPMNSKGLAQLAYDKGMYILTAAQSYQAAKEVSRSQVGQKIEHGLLTFALLEGLTKGKPDSQGRITEREWMNYAVDQVPLMQMEEMKKRNAEIKQRSGPGQRSSELVFVGGDNGGIDPEKRNVQRPRVFYRRELELRPLIVAKQ